jgi:hypothetical protein
VLDYSIENYDLDEVQAIDATSADRVQASQHYSIRTDYTFVGVKASVLIKCETGAILDIHCPTKSPPDTKIGWQVYCEI